jgi:hypothetical protein
MAQNSEWNSKNLAHRNTWFILKMLNQSSKDFKSSGKLEMKNLAFFNELASASDRYRNAETVVIPLMNLYKEIGEADYESGFDEAKTREALAAILSNGSKTMEELANVANECYKFQGEVS